MSGSPSFDQEEALRLRHGSEADQARLRAMAETDAGLAALIADWDRQDAAIRALYAPVAEEPIPDRLRKMITGARHAPRRPALPMWRIAAGVALLAFGFAAGWGGARFTQSPASPTLAQAAMTSFATYSVEARHPVEVGAEDEAHLVQWLSKRLGTPFHPPDLSTGGFRLIGGRLLPGATSPAALLMYEDDLGRRLALYLSRSEGRESDLAFAEEPGRQAFWWIEGNLGCALVGDLPRDTLRRLAIAAYHDLTEA
ncbi:anti-sigma factor [Tabrizicola sp.]|jgi:anti-sigma factor RsiW|uniref:anti-sigma factor family protein n=1 Tax=Tabrizicola sp. TaxID=2005166 RepID=UPI001A5BC93B|nr:anti-sigma factor [Tabrizicola sp.]MBL9064270.1 anti-sigma factor [Tabrizicola sp.]